MQSLVQHVSSSDRIHGSPSDFEIRLKAVTNHNRVAVTWASIAKSFYMVQSSFNTFVLSGVGIVTIPIGNYSINEFCSQVTSLITPGTCTFNSKIGKLTISHPSASSVVFPASSRLYRIMGFARESTTNFSAGSVTSTNICNFQIHSTVYLLSSLVNISNHTYDNLLCALPATSTQYFSFIQFLNNDPRNTARLMNPINNDVVSMIDIVASFKLIDEFGDLLEFNNSEHEFEIVTFREDNLYELMKSSMNYFYNYTEEQRNSQNQSQIKNQ
jgi:hypothetical protein